MVHYILNNNYNFEKIIKLTDYNIRFQFYVPIELFFIWMNEL